MHKILIWLSLLVFSINASSSKPPRPSKESAEKRMRFCNQAGSKVLEKLPELNANLSQINDSLVSLELASSKHNRCNQGSLPSDLSEEICGKIQKEYQQKIEEHAQIVLRNEKKQKEFLLVMKNHSNQHCPME